MHEIIKLLDTNKKGVEESAIRDTEQKLNIRFPNQYVQLFKLSNGPEVGEWILFPIKDPKNMKKTWTTWLDKTRTFWMMRILRT